MKAAYLDLANRLKVPGAQAKKAYKAAVAAQAAEDAKRAKRAAETVALMAKYRKVASTDPHQKSWRLRSSCWWRTPIWRTTATSAETSQTPWRPRVR